MYTFSDVNRLPDYAGDEAAWDFRGQEILPRCPRRNMIEIAREALERSRRALGVRLDCDAPVC